MIELRIPENRAYEWRQLHKDQAQILRQYTDTKTMERVFVIDYVSDEMSNKDNAIRIAKTDTACQYWAERGKTFAIVWRANTGSVWAPNLTEFLGWVQSFEDGYVFEGNGYDFLELYFSERSKKKVCVAPTWYCVDYDDHENPNLSKKQSYTLPRWGQKFITKFRAEQPTKESAIEILSEGWLT